jgi:ATP adenylyltransferase
MEYIQNHKRIEGCAFCTELSRPDGIENLIVVRARYNFVILNRFPYTSGHLMAVPFIHQSTLDALDINTRGEMMELVNQAIQVLDVVYKPQGFNVGINIGEAAGAGITEHIHMHVVPRWDGDTNFMSSLGETRVVPESLEETYQRVSAQWSQTHPPNTNSE